MLAARRTSTFTESVIREMTRIANQHEAVNLAQGFPDFPMPEPMKDAACAAIHGNINQYAVTWGSSALRIAIAEKYRRWYGMEVDHDREVTVTCGATEAMASVFLALLDPGDEVIVFEPFYENYGPDAILAGAIPTFVPLERPHWTIDPDRLKKAFTKRTKALVLNTPHNPTGRVMTRAEMTMIAELCIKHDVWVITDEIYEHIRYAGEHHVMATWPGMRERTITISGLSKTFSCTGWRLGYVVAPEAQTAAIRKVHDFLTVGAPAPLQAAGAVGDALRRRLLQPPRAGLSRAPHPALRRADGGRVQVHAARGRVLRARRLLGAERHGRRDVREVDVRGDRRRDGAGLELLLRPVARQVARPLRLLQEVRDAEASGGPAGDGEDGSVKPAVGSGGCGSDYAFPTRLTPNLPLPTGRIFGLYSVTRLRPRR